MIKSRIFVLSLWYTGEWSTQLFCCFTVFELELVNAENNEMNQNQTNNTLSRWPPSGEASSSVIKHNKIKNRCDSASPSFLALSSSSLITAIVECLRRSPSSLRKPSRAPRRPLEGFREP